METLIINNQKYNVLVAILEKEQQQGLMHVKWPPPIMAFAYPDSKIRKFWMKNTECPLDIVFCNKNKILDIKNGQPYSIESIYSKFPSDLVIEFPYGFCKNNNIKEFMDIKLTFSLKALGKLYKQALSLQ